MPIMRTPPPEDAPGHHGEFELYQRMAQLPIDDLELWFNVELPTVPEIDLIMNHPKIGAYIVEVKAMRLQEIASYTPDHLLRVDGKPSQHPIKQVKQAEFGLRNYLSRHRGELRVPYIQRTVIWPRITRAAWNERFNNPVVADQALAMIFADDLVDENQLLSTLRKVTQNPLGGAVPQAVQGSQPGMEILRRIMNYEDGAGVTSIPAEPDVLTAQEKLDLAGSSLKSQSRIAKYPAHQRHRVMFRGHPGSGKTTALRDLGVSHAEAGNSVLYICFNKVLAAKVRQEMHTMLASRGIKDASVTIADEYQLYRSLFPTVNRWELSKIPERARAIAEQADLISFDTILIDEAQDINGELLEVINLLTTETSSIFFAYGDGQQLYNLGRYKNGLSPQLADLMAKSETSQFNRVFRNSTTSQLVCAAVADRYPDTASAIEWLRIQAAKRSNSAEAGVMTLEFEDFNFEPTILVVDRDDSIEPEDDLRRLVRHLVDSSTNGQGEVNGLIIVSGSKSPHLEQVTKYLIEHGVPFADLTEDKNKRQTPNKDQLVITTYYGARGLTSQHTLILDSKYIEDHYTTKQRPTRNNVLNIALSRASGVTVIYTGTVSDHPERPVLANFVEAALEALQ